MDPARKTALGRNNPKLGKLRRVKRTIDLLRRQSKSNTSSVLFCSNLDRHIEDKIWLETHIWHAKRMHMQNMWDYRLVSV